jgi:hypothetical protein
MKPARPTSARGPLVCMTSTAPFGRRDSVVSFVPGPRDSVVTLRPSLGAVNSFSTTQPKRARGRKERWPNSDPGGRRSPGCRIQFAPTPHAPIRPHTIAHRPSVDGESPARPTCAHALCLLSVRTRHATLPANREPPCASSMCQTSMHVPQTARMTLLGPYTMRSKKQAFFR